MKKPRPGEPGGLGTIIGLSESGQSGPVTDGLLYAMEATALEKQDFTLPGSATDVLGESRRGVEL